MLYAVGDIHGESEMLAELLAKLPLAAGDRVVFVGDYVDRGPDSKGVVDQLIAFSREHTCEFLLGNHESMFLDFLGWRGAEYFGGDAFLMNGGDRTLASYDYFRQIGPGRPEFALPEGPRGVLPPTQALPSRGGLPVPARRDRPPPARRVRRRVGAEACAHRGSALGPRLRGPAPPAGRDDRLRPHAERGLRGALESALQHRHRHRPPSTAAASPPSACRTRRSFRCKGHASEARSEAEPSGGGGAGSARAVTAG